MTLTLQPNSTDPSGFRGENDLQIHGEKERPREKTATGAEGWPATGAEG
jgi:hypothetical protein